MNQREKNVRDFWMLTDILKGLFPSDVVAEISTVFFFLKRFTDLATASGSSGLLARYRKFASSFRTFSWETLANSADPGNALLSLLRKFEENLPELAGLSEQSKVVLSLSGRHDFGKQLRGIFTLLGSTSTGELSAEEARAVFQSFLDAMADHAASSVTPRSVRKLLVGLVSPQAGSSIYDPVCGYASLLCDAACSISKPTPAPNLFGQELQPSLVLLARMNAMLGNWEADIRVGDTLKFPQHVKDTELQKFDYVLANPPFGLRLDPGQIENDGYGRFQPVSPASSELAFVQHVEQSLADKGRGAILVPNGVLSRAGNDYKVRKHFIEADRIQAVISLPTHLFSGTPIAASILVLGGAKIGSAKKQVVFVDLTEHAEGPKTRRYLSEKGVADAVRCVLSPHTPTAFSAIIGHREIMANDYNLSVSRYVRIKESDGIRSFEEEQQLFVSAIEERDRAEKEALTLLSSFRTKQMALEQENPMEEM